MAIFVKGDFFAVIYECTGLTTTDGVTLIPGGQEVLLVDGESGAGEGERFESEKVFPQNTKVFRTKKEADEFMKDWEGRPWFYRREKSGKYRLVRVKEIVKPVVVGYEKEEGPIPL